MNNLELDVAIIKQSGLLDASWYLREYPDVAASSLNPVEHYVAVGARLLRNPNPSFSTKDYVNSEHYKCSGLGVNPLSHYIQREAAPQDKDREFPGDTGPPVKLSIVCVTYNHANYIRQTLDGFLSQQTDFDYEILIGDDCSTDGNAEIITEYARAHNEIVPVLRSSNVGTAQNLYDLFRRVRGQYVALCDGDDYWTDVEKLQLQINFLEKHPDYALCFHKVQVIYEPTPGLQTFFPLSCSADPSLDDLAKGNFIQTNSVVYRWRFSDGTLGRYNPYAVPHDWYMHLLHAEKGKIRYIDRVMSVYRRHAAGMWAQSHNEIRLHRRYGNEEIDFYRELSSHFDGAYSTLFQDRQHQIFSMLFEHYLNNESYDDLWSLLARNQDLWSRYRPFAGVEIDPKCMLTPTHLKNALRTQFKISVIVTTFCHERHLKACLESILAQRGCFTLEIIIGDDASPDGTATIVHQFIEEHPGIIHYLRHPTNIGLQKNIQACVDNSSGNYIAFCEGDDRWLSDVKLQKQLSFLRKNMDCGMCFNWVLLEFEESGSFQPHADQAKIAGDKIGFEELLKFPYTANFSACFYRAEAVKSIPDEFFSGVEADWLFNLYVAKTSKLGFIRELLSVYRLHSQGSWTGLSDIEKTFRIQNARQLISQRLGVVPIDVRYEITHCSNTAPGTVVQACLDAPVSGSAQIVDGCIPINGWAIPRVGTEAVIVIEYRGEIIVTRMEVRRPDLVLLGLDKNNGSVPRGFEAKIDFKGDGLIRIGLIGGEGFTWWAMITINAKHEK